jgi:hypothetical protein
VERKRYQHYNRHNINSPSAFFWSRHFWTPRRQVWSKVSFIDLARPIKHRYKVQTDEMYYFPRWPLVSVLSIISVLQVGAGFVNNLNQLLAVRYEESFRSQHAGQITYSDQRPSRPPIRLTSPCIPKMSFWCSYGRRMGARHGCRNGVSVWEPLFCPNQTLIACTIAGTCLLRHAGCIAAS